MHKYIQIYELSIIMYQINKTKKKQIFIDIAYEKINM